MRGLNSVPQSADEFANTFGVKSPSFLSKPRVGTPGLQLANAFGVNQQMPNYKIRVRSVSMNPAFLHL
jgi:hypothetical protein